MVNGSELVGLSLLSRFILPEPLLIDTELDEKAMVLPPLFGGYFLLLFSRRDTLWISSSGIFTSC